MAKNKKEGGFLPEGYKEPEGNYMKFQSGENVFRVLASAVTGYEYWNTDKKCIRSKKMWDITPNDVGRDDKGKIKPIKHFWVFPVWNYNAEKVQILEVTQKSIMSSMKAYVNNEKWGDPKGYDFTVTKTGSGLDTEYVVIANPHSEAPAVNFNINLEALFEGNDPFGGGGDIEIE